MSKSASAHKWSDLSVRATSGVVMAAGALVLIWIGGWIFSIACLILGGIIAWEWLRITSRGPKNISMIGIGLLYALVPALCLIYLRTLYREPVSYSVDIGRIALLTVVTTVIATDIGAYFAGRMIGGPKLAPKISPKKTWAGFLGGLASAIIIGLLIANYVRAIPLAADAARQLPIISIFQSVILSISSQLGDLFESWLKRRYNVKDSSNLIPGHGGVMDRLDGLIFAAPVAVLFIMASS
jgi:phosphatidate cytidylyltransferase